MTEKKQDKKARKIDVHCRPALNSDTVDVMELTRTIWDGEDYVPQVWAEWLADTGGRLAVAEYENRIVGLSKLTQLSPVDWWMEGLRVHPEYEGRGIASRLHDYLLDYWLQNGKGTIRLATASFQVKVHHISERTGFQKIAEFTPYIAPSVKYEGSIPLESLFQPLSTAHIPHAINLIKTNPTSDFAAGLVNLSWKWLRYSEVYLIDEIQKGHIWWWRGGLGLLAILIDDDFEGETVPVISLLACNLDELPTLLMDYRYLANQLGFKKANWFAPLHPELEPVLLAGGYQREWDASLYIYSKDHPGI